MASERVQQFIDTLSPSAVEIGGRYGLDPRLIMAQSALETGWGDSVSGNNYFGVKSHGRPGGQQVSTHEEINGQMVPVTDSFRTYDGVTDSMEDYAKFLRDNPRYSKVFEQKTLQDQIDEIARAGYATDSRYRPKLTAVANMIPPIGAGTAPPVMRAAPKPAGGGWLSALVGGGVNSALEAIKTQAVPIMRKAEQVGPAAFMQAMGTLEGRSAIGRYLTQMNVAKAPTMVPGFQPGGSQVMAVNNHGSSPATLMRATDGSRGGVSSQAFDNQYHGGQNMDVYRANTAAVGGGGNLNQARINAALMRGATLVRGVGGGNSGGQSLSTYGGARSVMES